MENACTGSLPTKIGFLTSLQSLDLCEWASSAARVKKDSRPVQLSHTVLVLLDSSQMTAENALTGPMPTEIGNLSALQTVLLCELASSTA